MDALSPAHLKPAGRLRFRVLTFIAARSLLRSPLSLVLLLLAVTAAVGFQIPNTANLDGYTRELLQQGLLRDVGHVLVTPGEDETFTNVSGMADTVGRQPPVAGVAVRLVRAAVIRRDGQQRAVRLVGLNGAAEEAVTGFCQRVAQGACPADGPGLQLVLGARLAAQLGVEPGARLRVVVPFVDLLGDLDSVSRQALVVGVLRGGGGFDVDYDAFTSLATLQQLLDLRDEANSVSVFLHREEQVAETAAELRQLLPAARVEPWWEVSELVSSSIRANRSIAQISMAMVIMAVIVPVLALLYIHVLQERAQIAVLGAIGFGRFEIFLSYLLKAVLVATIGTLLGILLGFGLCCYFAAHPLFSYNDFTVRPLLSPSAVLWPALVIFGVTVLAGLVPAIRAARANPAEELRQ